MEIPNSIKDTFVALPITVLYDKNTTMNEKLILMEAHQLSSLEKGCIASNAHFSKKLCIPVKSVSRLINTLKDKGYFNVDIKAGSRNHERKIEVNYTTYPQNEDTPKMTTDYPQNEDTPSPKCRETKENNKTNNKTNNKRGAFSFLDNSDLEYLANQIEAYSQILTVTHLEDYVSYRKKLKAPIRTITPLISFMKQLSEINFAGHKTEDAIETMKSNEWKTIKLDWYENIISRNATSQNKRLSPSGDTKSAIDRVFGSDSANNDDTPYIDAEVE